MVDLTTVKKAALFRGINGGGLPKLAAIGREVALPAGECLFRIGEPADTIYVVNTGILDLIVPINVLGVASDIELSRQTNGDAVGWSAMVEPFRLVFTARARTDVSLFGFTRVALLELFAADAGLGLAFMSNLGGIIGKRLDLTMKMWFAEIQRGVTAKFG